MTNKGAFCLWQAGGNVIHFTDGYSTQCSQYGNRFRTLRELYKYFLKEFIYI